MSSSIDPEAVLSSARSHIGVAYSRFQSVCFDDLQGFEWKVETYVDQAMEQAFLELLILTESKGLSTIHDLIRSTYAEAKTSRHGFLTQDTDPDGDPYLVWFDPLSRFVDSLETSFGLFTGQTVKKELLEIVRATQYAIGNNKCFRPPKCEAEVHDRIELVLRCIFPDLLRKPQISKPITHFVPDTGLPSIHTLIEYKFIERIGDVGRIANEILADTRGYVSKQWARFLYVIYETRRFKPEVEWKRLLLECGTARNTDVIVICGEPPPERRSVRSRKTDCETRGKSGKPVQKSHARGRGNHRGSTKAPQASEKP